MADETKAETVPAPAATSVAATTFEQVLEQFQKLTDYNERKAFYQAHPELARLISPNNFHA